MNSIKTYVQDGILQVTLDRPKANAIDLKTSIIMGEAFKKFRDDPSQKVLTQDQYIYLKKSDIIETFGAGTE